MTAPGVKRPLQGVIPAPRTLLLLLWAIIPLLAVIPVPGSALPLWGAVILVLVQFV